MNYLVGKRIPNAEAFLEHCERISMKSSAAVFRQGDPSEDLYLILDGSVSVIVDDIEDPEQEMVVSYLNPGEFFGEMGLFGEEHRTANLVTRTPCEFGHISYQDFHAIRQQFPDVLYALTTQIGQRLKNTTRKLADLTFIDERTYSSVAHSTDVIARGHDTPRWNADTGDATRARKTRRLLS
jgi:CRP/FNR family cyclic AMP-dependent transcriptional regulator